MTSRLLALTAGIALLAPGLLPRRSDDRAGLPPLMLWAWERPLDLRGLPAHTGVAFLAQTLTVSATTHVVAPRRQPLHVDPETPLVAVTRIEAPGAVPGAGGDVGGIADAIARTAELPSVRGVQVDFDAGTSQRAMYRHLLHQVRRALKPGTPLSITALASWCMQDNWLDDLPVDEAVPMLFRMGPSQLALRSQAADAMRARSCQGTLGISLDEPTNLSRPPARLYVFNPGPWTASSLAAAARQVKR